MKRVGAGLLQHCLGNFAFGIPDVQKPSLSEHGEMAASASHSMYIIMCTDLATSHFPSGWHSDACNVSVCHHGLHTQSTIHSHIPQIVQCML